MSDAPQQAESRNLLKPGKWSALPNILVDGGAVKNIRAAALRCYLAMVRKARWRKGGKVIISQPELNKLTGVALRTVRAAIDELETSNLIVRLSRGGGRKGDAAVYQVVVQDENRQRLPQLDGLRRPMQCRQQK
ncbi:MAG: hypothetical protein QUV05_18415 [Phycisphaerae bacterium]|nr:hypothetical protein [Phycisphaerae bacterium]